MERAEKLKIFALLKEKTHNFDVEVLELSLMAYCLNSFNKTLSDYGLEYELVSSELVSLFEKVGFPAEVDVIIDFFETLLKDDVKESKGIVFTPKYISDYIIKAIFKDIEVWNTESKIIDPGCGCGVFLVSAIEFIAKNFNVDIRELVINNIYAIDVDADNVRRCKYVVLLACAANQVDLKMSDINCICADSLKSRLGNHWGIENFDFIIGNPPYVNPHALPSEQSKFLKENFRTTQKGVFNIFYAFLEQGSKNLSETGKLGFIVPNNFLTIKSAKELRKFLKENRLIQSILDLGENMVFSPIRTYNCIIVLSKENKEDFDFSLVEKVNCVESVLDKIDFYKIPFANLDENSWKLVDSNIRDNLIKIESQFISLKELIRTGIATLRDNVYFVDKDENGYFKIINDERIYIEEGLVKPIYKISDLKADVDCNDVKRHIIFPYKKNQGKYEVIEEIEFKTKYPETYRCLLRNKNKLDERDKGASKNKNWYAYGRSQGLNKYGNKLLYPTFSKYPKFMHVEEEDTLFCNGYAVFESNIIELRVLSKILNSSIMEYYIRNTSYMIEGGFYCYQKKYLERFSIPWLDDSEIEFLKNADKDNVDSFLLKKYDLAI